MNFEAFLQITQTTLNMTRKIAYYSFKQRRDSDLSLLPSSIHTTSFMDGRLTGSEEMHHTPCHCHPLKPFIVIHCFTIMAYYVSQSLSALKKLTTQSTSMIPSSPCVSSSLPQNMISNNITPKLKKHPLFL